MKRPLIVLVSLLFPTAALAQKEPSPPEGTFDAPDDSLGAATRTPPKTRDLRAELPVVAYTYTAYGAPKGAVGVQAYGIGLAAANQDGVVGGGGAVWFSPIERLTLVIDGRRNVSRDFSPSAGAIVRLYGSGHDGLSIGALAKFKIDGFGKGPDGDEVESELEGGALVSFVGSAFHFDANAIGGRGLGDDGETDAEGRLRLGYDLSSIVRVGLDGQARVRLAGPRVLANGRTWDFAAGPQMVACFGNWFGAFTAGPTTMGLVSKSVGATAMLSVGGTVF